MCRSSNSCVRPRSACERPAAASTTRTAISVWSSTRRARRTRSSPSVPSSSSPGVSMITTGPRGAAPSPCGQGRSLYRAPHGDYGKLLPGHTVDQTGFACIAQTEKADVRAPQIPALRLMAQPSSEAEIAAVGRADGVDVLCCKRADLFIRDLVQFAVDPAPCRRGVYPHSRNRQEILQASSVRSDGSS